MIITSSIGCIWHDTIKIGAMCYFIISNDIERQTSAI